MARRKRIKPYFGRGRTINAGHPFYVTYKDDKIKEYIGLTHSNITDGKKNIKLDKNPNPDDSRTAYIRPTVEYTSEKVTRKYPNWRLSPSDKVKVKRVINQNKKR